MAKPVIDYTLYLVTDRDLMAAETLEECIEAACRGGTTLVQVREKHAGTGEFIRIARSAKEVTDAFGVPLIIDDDVEVALAVGAAGVHVGQSDLPATEVRRLVGPDMVVGVSVGSVEEALRAEADGADYLGVGAMSATATKPDAEVCTIDEARRITLAVGIPCVLIGGVNARTIPLFAGIPAAGYAVVSAIMAASDPEAASRELRQAIGR